LTYCVYSNRGDNTAGMTTKMDQRFFESTRGQIIRLMRGTTKSVNELAEELELTDNAVRAQLLSLERDGLMRRVSVFQFPVEHHGGDFKDHVEFY
jgi:predicted ArsR family transcriptional regulator